MERLVGDGGYLGCVDGGVADLCEGAHGNSSACFLPQFVDLLSSCW